MTDLKKFTKFPEKAPVKELVIGMVTGCVPINLLKNNSFQGMFQRNFEIFQSY